MDFDWDAVWYTVLVVFMLYGLVQWQRWRRLQRGLRTVQDERKKLRAMHFVHRGDAGGEAPLPPLDAPSSRRGRYMFYLLLAALFWLVGSIWMKQYAIAQAVDGYDSAVKASDRSAACRYAGDAVQAYLDVGDDEAFNRWRLTERKTCTR